jgi:hypothetical protein
VVSSIFDLDFMKTMERTISKKLKTEKYDRELLHSLVILYNCIHGNSLIYHSNKVKNSNLFFENGGEMLLGGLTKKFLERDEFFKEIRRYEELELLNIVDNNEFLVDFNEKAKEIPNLPRDEKNEKSISFKMNNPKSAKDIPKKKEFEENKFYFYEQFYLTLLINESIIHNHNIDDPMKTYLVQNFKGRNYLSKISSSLSFLNLNDLNFEINGTKLILESKIKFYLITYMREHFDERFTKQKFQKLFEKVKGTYLEHYLNYKLLKNIPEFYSEKENELKNAILHPSGFGMKDADLSFEIAMLFWDQGKLSDSLEAIENTLRLSPGYFPLKLFFYGTCRIAENNPNYSESQIIMYKLVELDCWGVCQRRKKKNK